MGFFDDFIHGKEKTYKADPLAAGINTAGNSGLSMLQGGADSLNKNIYQNPTGYVDSQIGLENSAIRSASEDATKRTRDLLARRGMSGSSIGLGQEINQQRDVDQKLALNQASGMARLKGLGEDQMKTGASLFNVKQQQGPVQMQDQTQRVGGYGQLISAGMGVAGQLGGAYLGRK